MTAKMRQLQETGDAKISRKLLKPQVERRRRERMNKSLESLRHLLLQGVQQEGGAQRRLEKAEILEHTVRFLSTVPQGASQTAGGRPGHKASQTAGGHGGAAKEGFSACMQRAVRYLGQHAEGRRAEAAREAALVTRFASSHPAGLTPAAELRSSSPPPTNLLLSISRQIKAGHCQRTRVDGMGDRVTASRGSAVQWGPPGAALNQAEVQSQMTPPRSSPSLWRPWP